MESSLWPLQLHLEAVEQMHCVICTVKAKIFGLIDRDGRYLEYMKLETSLSHKFYSSHSVRSSKWRHVENRLIKLEAISSTLLNLTDWWEQWISLEHQKLCIRAVSVLPWESAVCTCKNAMFSGGVCMGCVSAAFS